MKAIWLSIITCGAVFGQGGSADRVVASTPVAHETIVVKLLRPFEPETAPYRPITSSERFHQLLNATVSPYQLLREGAAAAVSQGFGSPREWGGGMEGYAKRLGNDLAENAVRNTLSFGVAAALHEDDRYFASGRKGTAGRILHAVLSPLEARHEDGSVGFSYSNATGVVGASLIARTWAPPSWRHGANVGEDIGISLAGQAAFNVFREFVPDLLHRNR